MKQANFSCQRIGKDLQVKTLEDYSKGSSEIMLSRQRLDNVLI